MQKQQSFPSRNLGIPQISVQVSVCGGPKWSNRGIPAGAIDEKCNRFQRQKIEIKDRKSLFQGSGDQTEI